MNSTNSSRETHENILNVSSAHYNFHTYSHISRSVVAWCWSSLQLSTFIGTSQCLLGICHWLVLSSWRSGFITKILLPIPRKNILHVTYDLKTCLSDQSVLWTRPKSHRCHHPHTDWAISELSSHGSEWMLPEWPTLVWCSSWQHRNSSRYHFLFLAMHRVKAEHFPWPPF